MDDNYPHHGNESFSLEEGMKRAYKNDLIILAFGSGDERIRNEAARIITDKSGSVSDVGNLLSLCREDVLSEEVRIVAGMRAITILKEKEKPQPAYLKLLEMGRDPALHEDIRMEAGMMAVGADIRLSRADEAEIRSRGAFALIKHSHDETLPFAVRNRARKGLEVIAELIEKSIRGEMVRKYKRFLEEKKKTNGAPRERRLSVW